MCGGGNRGNPGVIWRRRAHSLHELPDARRAGGDIERCSSAPAACPGGGSEDASAQGVPGGCRRRPDRDRNVLGGDRCSRGIPAVRGDRQASLRPADRSGGDGPYPGDPGQRRRSLCRVPGPRSGAGSAPGDRASVAEKRRFRIDRPARPQGDHEGIRVDFPGEPARNAVDPRSVRGVRFFPSVRDGQGRGGEERAR